MTKLTFTAPTDRQLESIESATKTQVKKASKEELFQIRSVKLFSVVSFINDKIKEHGLKLRLTKSEYKHFVAGQKLVNSMFKRTLHLA